MFGTPAVESRVISAQRGSRFPAPGLTWLDGPGSTAARPGHMCSGELCLVNTGATDPERKNSRSTKTPDNLPCLSAGLKTAKGTKVHLCDVKFCFGVW